LNDIEIVITVYNGEVAAVVDRSKGFQAAANAIMILLAAFCLLPFLLLISSSLSSEGSLIKGGYSFWPRELDLSAYKYLLIDSGDLIRGYGISVAVTFLGTILNLALTTLFAYPLSRRQLPGRNAISFILFFTMLFNGGLVPSYIMWTQTFHIKNTLWALILPNLMMNAFNAIMMRTYFTTTIPEAVIEAAKADGAGEFRLLWQIVLPMSLPIISTLALLVGLAYWNDWINGLYYINQDKYFSVQVLLNKMLLDTQFLKSSAGSRLNIDTRQMPSTAIKMAVAVLGALPVLVVYPFFQRFFVKGIAIGAVKG
jgi:putative aldouronate transport system permease protein